MRVDVRASGQWPAAPGNRWITGAVASVMALGLAIVAGAGCARVDTQDVQVRTLNLPKPQLVVVHDFTVAASAVALDSGIISRLRQMEEGSPQADQLKVAQSVSKALTGSLVQEIGKLGIPTRAASEATPVAGSGLAIEGQFLSVDQGNQMRRMVIGFGAGASEVRTAVQIYDTTGTGPRLVEDFYTTVKSARRPGMGPMGGVGAAAGHAVTSVVVSGAAGALGERSSTVEGDAKNAAKEITKQVAKFFAAQGWITQEQAEAAQRPW